MTGDDSVHGAQTQEFGMSFQAGDVPFVTSGSILPAILIQAIVGQILRLVRLLLSPIGEIY
jgi:hypothetical protein